MQVLICADHAPHRCGPFFSEPQKTSTVKTRVAAPILATAFFGSLLLSSCSPFAPIEANYVSLTPHTYPPNKSGDIMFLASVPKGYIVIGKLALVTNVSNSFVKAGLRHVARKVGADAVVIASSKSEMRRIARHVPGHTSLAISSTTTNVYGNASGYYGNSGYGYANFNATADSTTMTPVYHPGYTAVNDEMFTTVYTYFIRKTERATQ